MRVPDDTAIGGRLRQARAEARITQAGAGGESGVPVVLESPDDREPPERTGRDGDDHEDEQADAFPRRGPHLGERAVQGQQGAERGEGGQGRARALPRVLLPGPGTVVRAVGRCRASTAALAAGRGRAVVTERRAHQAPELPAGQHRVHPARFRD